MIRYIHIFITEVAANQSCAEDFRANMPCIIISLTHLFVSLGMSESQKKKKEKKEGIFYSSETAP